MITDLVEPLILVICVESIRPIYNVVGRWYFVCQINDGHLAVQYFGAVCNAISVAGLSDMSTIVMQILRLVWWWFWPKRAAIQMVCSIAVVWAVWVRRNQIIEMTLKCNSTKFTCLNSNWCCPPMSLHLSIFSNLSLGGCQHIEPLVPFALCIVVVER